MSAEAAPPIAPEEDIQARIAAAEAAAEAHRLERENSQVDFAEQLARAEAHVASGEQTLQNVPPADHESARLIGTEAQEIRQNATKIRQTERTQAYKEEMRKLQENPADLNGGGWVEADELATERAAKRMEASNLEAANLAQEIGLEQDIKHGRMDSAATRLDKVLTQASHNNDRESWDRFSKHWNSLTPEQREQYAARPEMTSRLDALYEQANGSNNPDDWSRFNRTLSTLSPEQRTAYNRHAENQVATTQTDAVQRGRMASNFMNGATVGRGFRANQTANAETVPDHVRRTTEGHLVDESTQDLTADLELLQSANSTTPSAAETDGGWTVEQLDELLERARKDPSGIGHETLNHVLDGMSVEEVKRWREESPFLNRTDHSRPAHVVKPQTSVPVQAATPFSHQTPPTATVGRDGVINFGDTTATDPNNRVDVPDLDFTDGAQESMTASARDRAERNRALEELYDLAEITTEDTYQAFNDKLGELDDKYPGLGQEWGRFFREKLGVAKEAGTLNNDYEDDEDYGDLDLEDDDLEGFVDAEENGTKEKNPWENLSPEEHQERREELADRVRQLRAEQRRGNILFRVGRSIVRGWRNSPTPEEVAHTEVYGDARDETIRSVLLADPDLWYEEPGNPASGMLDKDGEEYRSRIEAEFWKRAAGFDTDTQTPERNTLNYPDVPRTRARINAQRLAIDVAPTILDEVRQERPRRAGESVRDYNRALVRGLTEGMNIAYRDLLVDEFGAPAPRRLSLGELDRRESREDIANELVTGRRRPDRQRPTPELHTRDQRRFDQLAEENERHEGEDLDAYSKRLAKLYEGMKRRERRQLGRA